MCYFPKYTHQINVLLLINPTKKFIKNKQVEILEVQFISNIELFTTWFDATNQIEIGKIRVLVHAQLYSENLKVFCIKVKDEIMSFPTENMISNNVS